MEKRHLDKFYKDILKNPLYKQYGLILPITVIYKNLFNDAECFTKKTYDLIHSDIDVLAALYFNGEPLTSEELYDSTTCLKKTLTPTDLYAATVFSSGGMTKILKKLEDKELISRCACPNDKRSLLVSLEKKGEDIILDCLEKLVLRREEFFSILSDSEKQTLENILKKLTYQLF
ncbi:MarR family winged helix-turn-helix transcriptional regulator [Arcobacter sp. CECT 8985]|uniref:MarR family winged helix-turn-helix transcriptional regulator n=1 Tax=Arcobacter sp. CECT 8985 TaxID=1935424 RepID=UPI00100BCEE1|nr:MarR family transcriptional regulator [Arcobacter sp. CECT 8985]RXJ88049.1 MarR family transcriptional regulator [Arcobacter sp. CECT 8985]